MGLRLEGGQLNNHQYVVQGKDQKRQQTCAPLSTSEEKRNQGGEQVGYRLGTKGQLSKMNMFSRCESTLSTPYFS